MPVFPEHFAAFSLALFGAFIGAMVVRGIRRARLQRRLDGARDGRIAALPTRDALLPEELFHFRRFLRATWGEDTPDLVASFWELRDRARPLVLWEQRVLPLDEGLDDCRDDLECWLREQSVVGAVPREATLRSAWTFLNLPERKRDLVIRTYHGPGGFRHVSYLLDSEGTLLPLSDRTDDFLERMLTPLRVSYRSALRSLLEEGDAECAREEFARILAHDMTHAPSHAWLAHICRTEEGDAGKVRNHLSFAQEFGSTQLLGQIEAAYLGDGEPPLLRQLARRLAEDRDSDGLLPFLLAQSFLALKNGRISRRMCEHLLLEFPDHEQASYLLQVIDQRERGAQT